MYHTYVRNSVENMIIMDSVILPDPDLILNNDLNDRL